MTTLAEIPFEQLKAGMRFLHPVHGEQIILELSRGALALSIHFHDCDVYSGRMPDPGTGEEDGDGVSLFEELASTTYPAGAGDWVFTGKLTADEALQHGWRGYFVDCPHCDYRHVLLAEEPPTGGRACLGCGMVFIRPASSASPQAS
jgi:hypothetical protein